MHHGKLDKKTAMGLRELRGRIDKAGIPPSKLDETINIATWNIREFGRKARLKPSIHYIAEVIGQFDLVAVVEVRDNMKDMQRVLDILGPYWSVVFSDYIKDRQGNGERIAYVFDKRAVTFTGLAAEADPPRKKDRITGEMVSRLSWWRSPYMASFRAGNFDFILLTAHIRWGSGDDARIAPLKLLAEWVAKRRKEKHVIDRDFIVMGDFNIPELDDDLFKAITSKGLRIPEKLRGTTHGSNLEKNKRYDQILHYPTETSVFTDKGGVLDFYDGGIAKLYPGAGLSKDSFTYQMSDHLPLWMHLKVDISEELLDQYINPGESSKKKKTSRKKG